jgi:Copper transport outer membrane protein, MctB
MRSIRFVVAWMLAVVAGVASGLVIASALRHGPLAESVRTVAAADTQGRDVEQVLDSLSARLAAGQEFAEQVAPSLLGGRLTGRSVLVLTTDAGAAEVPGIEAMLTAGGASLAGRLFLTSRFVEPERRNQLVDLAVVFMPPGSSGVLPPTADGVTAGAALLGAVLMRREPAVPIEHVRSTLSAFTNQGFLSGASQVSGPADAVVVVTGAAERGALAIAALAAGLRAKAVVLAGTDAGAGTAVGAVRANTELTAALSTVDGVQTPQGKLVTAWALADQLGGRVGHYGTGPGATSVLPATAS